MALLTHHTFTPTIDSQTGRLAELVHLLADVPIDAALEQFDDAPEHPVDDPLWMVAGALVRLGLRHPDAQVPASPRPRSTEELALV